MEKEIVYEGKLGKYKKERTLYDEPHCKVHLCKDLNSEIK